MIPITRIKIFLPWKKVEILLSLSFYLIPVAFLFHDAYILSHDLDSKYQIAEVKSSPYFENQKIDQNDGQLKSFLEGLPLLTFFVFIFVGLRRILYRLHKSVTLSLLFYALCGLGYGAYINGPGVIFLFGTIITNYYIAKVAAGKKGFPVIVWIGNLSFLVLAKYYKGFKFGWLYEGLELLDEVKVTFNWHRVHNLFTLKVISYMMDFHWKKSDKIVNSYEKHNEKCDECKNEVFCLRFRMESHGKRFGLMCFVGYCFYPPLYLAGPTLTYNAWISQVENPQQTYDLKRIFIYILRFIGMFFLLLWFIHNFYFPTIANNSNNRYILDGFTPYELIIASYFILNWIWLKFTIIWRYFRIWALFDGIESPENINRCMSNNYCFEGFWRSWHRSFNQWLIRYLFIPLGGSRYKVINIWIVFGFVAIWHELNLTLLAWGWGMCLFIVPEIMIKSYFASPKRKWFRETVVYSFMCAVAGGFYICLMATANLVGYSFGLSGLRVAVGDVSNWEGLFLIIRVVAVLSFGTHFMILYREYEVSRGNKDKGY